MEPILSPSRYQDANDRYGRHAHRERRENQQPRPARSIRHNRQSRVALRLKLARRAIRLKRLVGDAVARPP